MQDAVSPSWHVVVDDRAELAHLALHVRDSASLPTAADSSRPPRLSGHVVDVAPVLTAEVREIAGAQWDTWWNSVLGYEGALRRRVHDLKGSATLKRQAIAAGRNQLFDWPELSAMEQSPELARVIRGVHDGYERWRDAAFAADPGHPEPGPVADLDARKSTRAAAVEIINRYGVDAERVRAWVLVLSVSGAWSHRPSPGVLVCSRTVLNQPDVYQRLLEQTFVDALGDR